MFGILFQCLKKPHQTRNNTRRTRRGQCRFNPVTEVRILCASGSDHSSHSACTGSYTNADSVCGGHPVLRAGPYGPGTRHTSPAPLRSWRRHRTLTSTGKGEGQRESGQSPPTARLATQRASLWINPMVIGSRALWILIAC